ncbi:MAG: hypothetical protein ACREH4_02020 [Vitreimonas sp.]
MKVLIGAAAAAVMLTAAPAFAQTNISPNCTGFEAAPTLPDGATANRAEIEAMNTQVQTWDTARRNKLLACQADINAMSQAFNTAQQERQALSAAWNAEVTEFNGRSTSSSSNRRERGGVTRPGRQ